MTDDETSMRGSERAIINLDVKQAILDAVVRDGRPPSKVAKAMHLNRKSVEKVAQKGRKGYTFHAQEGRPRVLDSVALDSLRQFLKDHPHLSSDQKSEAVQREYTKYQSKINGVSTVDNLSRRSVGRYLKKLEKESTV